MTAEQIAEHLPERVGIDNTLRLARNNIFAADETIERLRKQSDKATDPNKLIGIEKQLRQAQAARDKYVSVLDLLGASERADETESERYGRLKKENTNWIGALFPYGLPSARSVILADIASGKKIRWSDRMSNGAVTSRGLGAHLGLADSNAERKRRFGLLSNDAPTPEAYAEELAERLRAMGIPFDETELLDEVLDVYQDVDTRSGARKALEELAASPEEEDMDYEEYQMQRAYERSRKELQEIGKDNNFVENDNDGKRPDENNSQRLQDTAYDGGGVAADAAVGVARTGDRSDIRVLAPQMAAPYGEYPDDSTRYRQSSESERLIAAAKRNYRKLE